MTLDNESTVSSRLNEVVNGICLYATSLSYCASFSKRPVLGSILLVFKHGSWSKSLNHKLLTCCKRRRSCITRRVTIVASTATVLLATVVIIITTVMTKTMNHRVHAPSTAGNKSKHLGASHYINVVVMYGLGPNWN